MKVHHCKISTILLEIPIPNRFFFLFKDVEESIRNNRYRNNVVYELKTLANELNDEHPMANLELPSDDTPFSINITSNLCRLCLENSPPMWNFFSIITLDDQSTIDVVVAFEKLTGEHVEEVLIHSSS